MSAIDLLVDLARRGIRLEAHGERLRFHPRSAVTPDLLLDRLKAHKADLLATLRAAPHKARGATAAAVVDIPPVSLARPAKRIVERFPLPANPRDKPKCRCGSTTWRDVPIHGGQSVRRDCGRCGRFLDFPVWYGKDTGHTGQHPI